MRLSLLVTIVVLIAVVAQAQTSSNDQVSRDVSDHGLSGMRCDSFLTFQGEKASEQIARMVGTWVDGYVRGLGLALLVTTQEPGKSVLASVEAKSPNEHVSTTLAAALISAIRGMPPPLLEPQSIATRQSQLSDYCQQHRDESIEQAARSMFMKGLKLP